MDKGKENQKTNSMMRRGFIKAASVVRKTQQEIYDISAMNRYRYIILNWSRQSGKSILAKILCIKWLVMKEQYIGYVTPNFVLAKKIYNDIYTLLKDSKLVKKANAQDLIITTITNSTLHFFSSESAVSIRVTHSQN